MASMKALAFNYAHPPPFVVQPKVGWFARGVGDDCQKAKNWEEKIIHTGGLYIRVLAATFDGQDRRIIFLEIIRSIFGG